MEKMALNKNPNTIFNGFKNYNIYYFFKVFLIVIIIFISCSDNRSEQLLQVFAAGGAKPAIDEINKEFKNRNHIYIEAIYGGGGEVLSKMILTKKGDIFIAPDQRFMERAVKEDVVYLETVQTVAYLIPVIAVKKNNPKGIYSLDHLSNPGIRLSITRPETTLVGSIAPEIFKKIGLEKAIMKNIVTYASDPNNLLTMLIMGQVDAGIIWQFYGTIASKNIEVIYMDPKQIAGIGQMQIAVTRYCKNKTFAQNYIDFSISNKGKAIFKKCGYNVNLEEIRKYRNY